MPPGIVLDVGAAAGFVIKAFVDAGWSGVGLEPNDSMAAYGRGRLGLDVRTGTLETFESTERYDLVTMIQVLPHLWDLHRALETASAVTAPGGHWLIETWDRGSLTARVLGKRWHEYSPPSVLHWFDRDGVARLAGQYGFHQVDHGRRLKWILGSHSVSLVKYKTEGTPVERLVDRLGRLVPARLPYPSEDLFWMLLKKDPDG